MVVCAAGDVFGRAAQCTPRGVAQGAPPTEPSRATVVRGRVVRPAGVPVIGATVELFETEERATSDSTGAFLLRTTWTGPATLVARFVGDPPVAVELRLPLDSAITLVLPRGVVRLAEFTVLPPGEFRLANATRTEALTPLDVVQTPGADGDVVRALQLAPGVGNVDEGNGLFVRGGDVTETRVLVDDVVMSLTRPGERRTMVGSAPRRSSTVCSLMPTVVCRYVAHGSTLRHKRMSGASSAYTDSCSARSSGSFAYRGRVCAMTNSAKSRKMRQSRRSFASANVLRLTGARSPM